MVLLMMLLITATGCEKSPTAEETKTSEAQKNADNTDKALIEMQKSGEVSDFKKIMITGAIGDGVIARYLRADGRDFSGTNDAHDAQLIDSSTMTETVAVAAIKQALTADKTIIVDGSDNVEATTRTNKIMNDAVGFSVEGATAYAISKSPDGAKFVTPLDSIANAEGVKTIDQAKTFFQRNIK